MKITLTGVIDNQRLLDDVSRAAEEMSEDFRNLSRAVDDATRKMGRMAGKEEKYEIEERLYHLGLLWLGEISKDDKIAVEPADVYENLISLLGELHARAMAGKLGAIRMPFMQPNPAIAAAMIKAQTSSQINVTINDVSAQDPERWLRAMAKLADRVRVDGLDTTESIGSFAVRTLSGLLNGMNSPSWQAPSEPKRRAILARINPPREPERRMCLHCNGSGAIGYDGVHCPHCNGTGLRQTVRDTK